MNYILPMVLSLLLFAVLTDFWKNWIPNLLILVGTVIGLLSNFYYFGLDGIWQGFGGMVVGFAVLLPLYYFGGMAAGDVKLMAMVGSFLTPKLALGAALFSLIAGGACALLLILFSGQLMRTLHRYLFIFTTWTYLSPASDDIAGRRFAYAVAIFLGTLVGYLQQPFGQ